MQLNIKSIRKFNLNFYFHCFYSILIKFNSKNVSGIDTLNEHTADIVLANPTSNFFNEFRTSFNRVRLDDI